MFAKGFDKYACHGDSITCTVDGFDVTARIYHDDHADAPAEMSDGFWPSLDPKSAGYIGHRSKGTLARHMAKARAVMDAWKNDEWFYCGIVLTVHKAGIPVVEKYHVALWGIECNYPGSDNSYLTEVANDLLGEALDLAKANVSKLCAA